MRWSISNLNLFQSLSFNSNFFVCLITSSICPPLCPSYSLSIIPSFLFTFMSLILAVYISIFSPRYPAVVSEWLEQYFCNLQRLQSCSDPGSNPAWGITFSGDYIAVDCDLALPNWLIEKWTMKHRYHVYTSVLWVNYNDCESLFRKKCNL